MIYFRNLMIFLTATLILFVYGACQTDNQRKKNIISDGVTEWIHLSSKTEDIPVPGPSTQQTACLIVDVDKDNLNDFILGSRKSGPSLLWYKREDYGWKKYIIENNTLPIEAGGTYFDIDKDGDVDLVFGGDSSSNKVWWWENPYPDYNEHIPWTRREIKNSGGYQHHDQIFGDFDADGEPELVFWNNRERKLYLAEIPSSPRTTQPWSYTEIYRSEIRMEGLAKSDVDGEGQIDIIGGGCWFNYKDNHKFSAHIIDENQGFSRAAAAQLIEGGWSEVVFVPGDEDGFLNWYEWTGKIWKKHQLLKNKVVHGHSLQLGDINGDKNLDILCAEMHTPGAKKKCKMRIFYGDGEGHFEKKELSTGIGNHESKLADLDGDGDLDILTKPYTWDTPRVDVWLNLGPINKKNFL